MNRFICRDIAGYRIKCFFLKYSYFFDNGMDDPENRDGSIVIWATNPSNAGRLLRDNNCYDIWDIMPHVLAIESYYYAEDEEDWLLNLPKTLKSIYQKRKESCIEDFSLKFSFDFWRDIRKLSDSEIYQLVEQKVEFYDNVGGVEHRFISSWKIEG